VIMREIPLILLALALFPGAAASAPPKTGIYSPEVEAKASALLRQMTLEEKVGQLSQYSAGQPTGPDAGSGYADAISSGGVGALLNISTAKETNAYQHVAVEKSRLHIPILFGLDVIHGFRTEFPIPLGLASTWDPTLVEKAARVAAGEAAASGVRWTFSPMVDLARDPRWGRIAEGAGEDPYLGSVIGAAYVRGYQGERLDLADSIAACAKHYVGYGAAEGGRDYNTTDISEHSLRQYYLPPFRAAVDAGAATVMSAFNSLNGVPASANAFTLRQILRSEWGFKGIVDSDWTSISELINHGVALDGRTAARKAFNAGVDMDMVSGLYRDHLPELVNSELVSKGDLDEAVRRVLRVKFALGLFDKPYVDESKEDKAMLTGAAVATARTAAERSFVLLKNDVRGPVAPVLPLSSGTIRVAVIGPLADDAGAMLGSWGARGQAQDAVTLRAALVAKLGAARVLYATGTGYRGGSDQELASALTVAKEADVVILALGEQPQEMTGEAASRSRLDLPGRQEELLEMVAATGKPVVLVLFSGRPLTLPWAFEHVPAVLAAWFPGVQAGPALVRTLFGEANPEGRLVVSWPRSLGQVPLYYNAMNTGRPARAVDLSKPPADGEQKYVSRYIDETNSPRFPFGYGLSYTTYRYGATEVSTSTLRASMLTAAILKGDDAISATALTASVTVANVGALPGTETVQLYIRLEGTSTAQPIAALKGFQKVALAPGESKKVVFSLSANSLALWDDHHRLVVEPSRLSVWAGPDALKGSPATVTLAP
jgi:beta-glucosidase